MCEDIRTLIRYGERISCIDKENESGAFRLMKIMYNGLAYTICAHNGCFCIMDAE